MVIMSNSPLLSQSTLDTVRCQAKLLLRCTRRALVHPRVDPADASQIGAGTGDLRKILLVRREIDAPRSLLRSHTLRAQVGDLFRNVGEIALKRRDQAFIAERRTVPRQ